jgi:hypothetical protein
MRFNHTDDHIHPFSLLPLRRCQHRKRLPHTRRTAKENLQFSSFRSFMRLLESRQQIIWVRTLGHMGLLIFSNNCFN